MISKKTLENLPTTPGVYIFCNHKGQALYVGKASNLKNRVSSYLQKGLALGPKTSAMLSKAAKVDHTETETEMEALLLESDLIKRLRPKYNEKLKDDKKFKYIRIEKRGDFPKIDTTRKKENKLLFERSLKLDERHSRELLDSPTERGRSKSKIQYYYFGPFPQGGTVEKVLKTLRKIFPFRDCSKTKFNKHAKIKRGCLYFDLKLCSGPCIGAVSKEQYKQNINRLIRFLKGRKKEIIAEYEKEMKKKAKNKEFEEAAKIRDQVNRLNYITQEFRQAAEYIKTPNLAEDQRWMEVRDLISKLKEHDIKIKQADRIEAYDISNIGGKQATGSMIVFINGEPKKSHYRRFKISERQSAIGNRQKPDDVAMMKETLKRRFKHLASQTSPLTSQSDESFTKIPDLILVDGGKPQVGAALDVLKKLNLRIPVIGLAKKNEEVISYPRITSRQARSIRGRQLSIINLPKDSPALHLLQRVRDEAHRFAIAYHKKLRGKDFANMVETPRRGVST